MIPNSSLQNVTTKQSYPSHTYKLNWGDSVRGYVDDISSIEQAIYKILSTERYEHTIYGHHWGVELNTLINKPLDFIKAEAPRRIKEALIQDDRISDAVDFVILRSTEKDSIAIEFTAVTVRGILKIHKEVGDF